MNKNKWGGKKRVRDTNTWRLSNTFLNNQQSTEEIKREIKHFQRQITVKTRQLKPVGCKKSSYKREVYRNKILPQEITTTTAKKSNRKPKFTTKTTG